MPNLNNTGRVGYYTRLIGLLALAMATVCVAVGQSTSPATTRSATTTSTQIPADAKVTPEGWFAPPKAATRPPLPAAVTKVFVIPIREEITGKTFDAIQRKIKRCRQSGAQLVILDMDTWGGEVIAALDISRALKVDLADVYTVCYVRTRGVSAGALIALACNEIVMTPVGTLGDCAPIVMGGKLEGVEREKMETVLRSEFSESAERSGYSQALAVSMVSMEVEVWEVRNKQTRQLQYGLAKDWRGQVVVPPGVTSAPSNPASEWELLRVVVTSNELLTMKTSDAVKYGFVKHVVKPSDREPYEALKSLYHIQAEPTVLSDTWSEKMVEILTSSTVTGFLFFVAILCGYIEINAPGHIIPGVISVLCLAIIFGSRYLTGMAGWWTIALFLAGVFLILLELIVIPGFGVAGILGIIFCLVGLVGILLPNRPGRIPFPQTTLDWSIFTNGLFALGIAFVCAVIAAAIIATYLPKLPIAGKLVLAPTSTSPDAAMTETTPLVRIKPGDLGVVESTCRPVGKVRFGEDLVDAVTEGGIIEPLTTVRVLRREGNRVVVETA